ncbi:MAG: valine--tRNA ligase [bacterium]|nr:valine--tRNA ligase [bacterium]
MSLLDAKRYDHQEAETLWSQFWEEQGIYRYDPQSSKPLFSVDTPPPYASAAHLHVGHAMSYSQAEILIRQKRMAGHNIFYPMGFDDNGLPTERYVEKKYQINKSKITRPEFVELCMKETKLVTESYRHFWRMLGISVDWSLEYSTISPPAVHVAQSSFLDLVKKGLAVRKKEPIMWDVSLQTALAQADIEAIERNGQLNDVAFHSADTGEELVISTTRPELIPACVALFCNPADSRYQHLLGKKAKVPLFDYEVPILTDDSVDLEFGTGLMMVCTFGDPEDIAKWHKYKLDTRVILNERGILGELAGEFAGEHVSKARAKVLEKLEEQGFLKGQKQTLQRVSVAERSGTPVEYIPHLQWFISLMDHADAFLKRAEELNWFPDYFQKRYDHWVEGLKWDWCVSRQRFYGVPIPVWYCGQCDAPIVAEPDELPIDPTSQGPKAKTCPHCGHGEFRAEQDVFDTWMTSSLTPQINSGLKLDAEGNWKADRPGLFPMNIRVQGFEIIRTWLFYTVVKGHFHQDSLPWKDVVISGWGLDKKGQKISKSKGNYEDPVEIVQKYSADALRYWSALGTLGHDLRYNEVEVKNGQKLLNKIYNSTRFLSMSLGEDYQHGWDDAALLPVDRWLLGGSDQVLTQVQAAFDKYDYSNALRAVERFFWDAYCDNYLEMIKFRLWNSEDNATNYTDAQIQAGKAVAVEVLFRLVKLFAPFIPFITEQVYQGFFKEKVGGPVSVHIAEWPEPLRQGYGEEDLAKGTKLDEVLGVIRKEKIENQIGIATKIRAAHLSGPADYVALCREFETEIASAVRAVAFTLTEAPELSAKIEAMPKG